MLTSAPEPRKKNSLSFGIGCFHFGIAAPAQFKFDGSRYVKQLRACLETIPSIGNVVLEGGKELAGMEVTDADKPLRIEQESIFFPRLPRDYRLKFEVRVPERLQQQILAKYSEWMDSEAEDFAVDIQRDFYGSVTFVRPLVAAFNPSLARIHRSAPRIDPVMVREEG